MLYEGYFVEDQIESEMALVYHYNAAVKYSGGYKKGRREGLGKLFHMNGALRYFFKTRVLFLFQKSSSVQLPQNVKNQFRFYGFVFSKFKF